jgi:hypothetical protein
MVSGRTLNEAIAKMGLTRPNSIQQMPGNLAYCEIGQGAGKFSFEELVPLGEDVGSVVSI